ncbi:hypothetical protein SARC_02448 [Sphaeroforma arctica JP610]|uniref:Uncharacterized protein n=1 Tax=Sphaeroforma arctica JP610 TaxID=667725 RepID=A0A0L0G900_9EUKA|nr:hypothetical protein SARC_02448 [Sphaeroforma arctica JP610]KNC85356.1 hypothetical protein SARC_02448 [Sphaeroforma arctica JP610]|eukprot:XP_014159258.1 hypothetical protein SARC_02448 [Sphaeroforma arctica JP610]
MLEHALRRQWRMTCGSSAGMIKERVGGKSGEGEPASRDVAGVTYGEVRAMDELAHPVRDVIHENGDETCDIGQGLEGGEVHHGFHTSIPETSQHNANTQSTSKTNTNQHNGQIPKDLMNHATTRPVLPSVETRSAARTKRESTRKFLQSYLLEMQVSESFVESRVAHLKQIYDQRVNNERTRSHGDVNSASNVTQLSSPQTDNAHTTKALDQDNFVDNRLVTTTGERKMGFEEENNDHATGADQSFVRDVNSEEMAKINRVMHKGDKAHQHALGSPYQRHATGPNSHRGSSDLEQLNNLSLSDDDLDALMPDTSGARDNKPKKWLPKYALYGHTDMAHCILFHTSDPVAFTGSADNTIKLWMLSRRSSPVGDKEPALLTYTGHSGAVCSLAMTLKRKLLFSASRDTTVRVWTIPELPCPPNAPNESPKCLYEFKQHGAPVSCVVVHPTKDLIASVSSDGACYVWKYSQDRLESSTDIYTPVLCRRGGDAKGAAIVVSFMNTSPRNVVVAYADGDIIIYDTQTGEEVLACKYDSEDEEKRGKPTHAVCHHTKALLIASYDDGRLFFFDTITGRQVNTHMAHPECVTHIAIDPTGLYYMTSSRDRSLRLWDMEAGRCVQEIATTHRQKDEESVLTVEWHPVRNFVASGGADGAIKVYTS